MSYNKNIPTDGSNYWKQNSIGKIHPHQTLEQTYLDESIFPSAAWGDTFWPTTTKSLARKSTALNCVGALAALSHGLRIDPSLLPLRTCVALPVVLSKEGLFQESEMPLNLSPAISALPVPSSELLLHRSSTHSGDILISFSKCWRKSEWALSSSSYCSPSSSSSGETMTAYPFDVFAGFINGFLLSKLLHEMSCSESIIRRCKLLCLKQENSFTGNWIHKNQRNAVANNVRTLNVHI